MSTTTLHGIPSSNYWQSHHLRMSENVQNLDHHCCCLHHHHHHHSIFSITVAVSRSYQVAWQDQKNQYQDTVQFGCVNIILCFLAH